MDVRLLEPKVVLDLKLLLPILKFTLVLIPAVPTLVRTKVRAFFGGLLGFLGRLGLGGERG